MRDTIHCPFCGTLLIAIDEVDLFILLRRHLDAEHEAFSIPDDEVHQYILYLAAQVV